MKKAYWIIISTTFLSVLLAGCKKATDESDNAINGSTTAVFNPDISYGSMRDVDGNLYKTVTIGTQTWMAENLRTTKYQDGTSISEIKDNKKWSLNEMSAYCNYDNTTNLDTIATWGRLYNWHAVNNFRKLAPAGWHIPTDGDWHILELALGEDLGIRAGGMLKESGNKHWQSENWGATNDYGFTALPSGYRDGNDGVFKGFKTRTYYWSSTEYDANKSRNRYILDGFWMFHRSYDDKKCGYAVRCVRD